MNIPFARIPLAGNELRYIEEVIRSGWYTTSAKTLQFEKLFAERVGARYACAVNSCTAALHLALEAIGVGPGDQVVVPTMTFTATAEVIRYLGADPLFTDVEYGTSLLTPAILEQALKSHPRIKAVIPVHFGGQAAQMRTAEEQGLVDICRKHRIFVIEDAAHAFPAYWGQTPIGSMGDAGCFSFYANKTITSGEGGMLVTNNEQIYKRAKVMRLHGIDRDVWDRFTSNRPSWEYDVVAPGYKYNMPDINAAIGLAQLEQADYFREQRQRCAMHYFKELRFVEQIDLPTFTEPAENHAWHLFPIILKPTASLSRNQFIDLMSEQQIGTSVHYKPLHRMTYYRERYQLCDLDFPNAERIWNGNVSLPIYPDLTNTELDYICEHIRQILGNSEPSVGSAANHLQSETN